MHWTKVWTFHWIKVRKWSFFCARKTLNNPKHLFGVFFKSESFWQKTPASYSPNEVIYVFAKTKARTECKNDTQIETLILASLMAWISFYLSHQAHLMHLVFSGKQRLSIHKLHKDATHRPHINGSSILWRVQQQLRCPVPSGDHIFSHELVLWSRSSKTEINDLQITICIQHKIAGFQISMNNICRMYVFQPSKDLIQEVLQRDSNHKIRTSLSFVIDSFIGKSLSL